MPKKLPIYDQRMLILMEHCISSGIEKTKKSFCKRINFPETSLRAVRAGVHSFTIAQVTAAAIVYDINLNWLMGIDPNMKRNKSANAIDQLKDAVKQIEVEFCKNDPVNKRVNNLKKHLKKSDT